MKKLTFALLAIAACSTLWWASHALDKTVQPQQAHAAAEKAEKHTPDSYPRAFKLQEPPKSLPAVTFLVAKEDDTLDETSLKSYAKGDVVLLNLWATWCVPCIKEMPAFNRLEKKYTGQGLKVIPLSQDVSDTMPTVAYNIREFYAKHKLEHLPVIIDKFGAAFRDLEAEGLPVTLIIDRKGKTRARVVGLIDWESEWFTAFLEQLLAEPK